jgi:hypothetical protein
MKVLKLYSLMETLLEFEMCLDRDPPLLNVFLTKPGKERKLY